MNVQEIEQTRAAWDAIAAGYDRFVTGTHMSLGEQALRKAGLQPGMRFLDVACGSGAMSLPAARLGADVLAVDISAGMIERLVARARAEGHSEVAGRVMDGHALQLANDSFDVAGSQFGVMLFPDLPAGVSEMVRVTRRGGRVVIIAFGPPTTVEFFGFFLAALQAAVPGFSPPAGPPPLPFQLADPATFRRVLTEAGLSQVSIATVAEQVTYDSGQHIWDWITHSNPIGADLVADLTAERGSLVRSVLDGMLRERAGGEGPAVLSQQVHIGIGTK